MEDMSLQCWQDYHIKLSIVHGFPVVLIWMLGIPIGGLKYLY